MYYIAHYGTKRHSGRYPYGSGDRPYQSSPTMAKQNKDEQRISKRASKVERRFNKNAIRAEQRINTRMQKIQQKPKYQQKINEQERQEKNKLINSANPSKILANQDRLTNKELKIAIERIKWNNELKYLQEKKSEENFNRIDNAMKKLNKISNWTRTGANIYSSISQIRNQNLYNQGKEAENRAKIAKSNAEASRAWQDMLTSQARGAANRAWANTDAYRAQAEMSNIAKEQNYKYKRSNFDLQNLYQSQAYKRAEDRTAHQKNMYYMQASIADRAKKANESYLNSLNKIRNNSLKSDSEYNKQLQQANLDYDDYIKKMLKRYA